MDGPSASALALRISSNSSTFDLVRMGPRLQPAVERSVDPYLAASRMGPERMITVGPAQVITPIGRFVTFARAVVPGLAGMSGLRYRTFLAYNALGGLLWGVGYTLLGYLVGHSFTRIVSDLSTASLVLIGVVALAVVVYVLLRRRSQRGRVEDRVPRPPAALGATGPGETGTTGN
jgi:hypothetical protein